MANKILVQLQDLMLQIKQAKTPSLFKASSKKTLKKKAFEGQFKLYTENSFFKEIKSNTNSCRVLRPSSSGQITFTFSTQDTSSISHTFQLTDNFNVQLEEAKKILSRIKKMKQGNQTCKYNRVNIDRMVNLLLRKIKEKKKNSTKSDENLKTMQKTDKIPKELNKVEILRQQLNEEKTEKEKAFHQGQVLIKQQAQYIAQLKRKLEQYE